MSSFTDGAAATDIDRQRTRAAVCAVRSESSEGREDGGGRAATRRRASQVADPRVKTRAATANAMRLAERVQARDPSLKDAEEQSFFVALRVCDFRAGGAPWSRPSEATQAQARWLERWRLIRDYIVEQNIGLVYTMMGRFRSAGVDVDELTSDAMMAFIRAVEQFNPFLGFRFSTYACNVIVRAAIRRKRSIASHQQRFRGSDCGFFDPDSMSGKKAVTSLYLERMHRAIRQNLAGLTPMELHVISKRFPTDHSPAPTLKEIGLASGFSKERIRQLQNQALLKLRAALLADPALK